MCDMKCCRKQPRRNFTVFSVPLRVLRRGRARHSKLIWEYVTTGKGAKEICIAEDWVRTHRGRVDLPGYPDPKKT